MRSTLVLAACFLVALTSLAQSESQSTPLPSFDYNTAQSHEIKPHRSSIPHEGVGEGFNQLHLTLTVSATGDVTHASAEGEEKMLQYWPDLENEVYAWKFTPFEVGGSPVTAQVEEYIDLVPPERQPKRHVPPPVLKPNSQISISLSRSGCFGSCPSYEVTITTTGVEFNGEGFVVAKGKHIASVDKDSVRELARKFIRSDFYSMEDKYLANVTDLPSQQLSISVDGRTKKVIDYAGEWVGMPSIVAELEKDVDTLAGTQRWVDGTGGLVDALQAENYKFNSFEAQIILKEASSRGETEVVQQLLDAGVPLSPLPAPKLKDPDEVIPFDKVGMLAAAASHPDILKILIDRQVSVSNQAEKDLALFSAASAGSLDSVRMLIAYGANPNVDLSKLTLTTGGPGLEIQGPGRGSILYYAASSGNPDVVREILKYHPNLEIPGMYGQTALFATSEWRSSDTEGARVECEKLLLDAGANINARDDDGNTPLHEIYLTDVVEELLKRGANVNAQNNDGDTPIVTNVDNDSIPLFLKYGANLYLQNKDGKTMLEAANEKGPDRQKALRDAIAAMQSK